MARTPLAGTLEQIAAQASTDAGTAPRPTRRQLLAGSAGIAAAAAAGRFAPAARAADSPRIVVVGAGLAGLSCAYRLKQAGYTRAGLRGLGPHRRALLVGSHLVRERADRGARRRADRPGPYRDPPARVGARPQARQPPHRPSATAPSRSTTSTASPTRMQRPWPTSRRSGSSFTPTPRRRAIPRSTTCPPSVGASSTTCRSRTRSTHMCRAGAPRSSASSSMWPTTSSTGQRRASRAR